MTEDKIISINPGNIDEVIGRVSKASKELAEKAMQEALITSETWKRVSARERAEYLFKASELMRERKYEFAAMMVLEAGKNWIEADIDTAEAIDFMEFPAGYLCRMTTRRLFVAIPSF